MSVLQGRTCQTGLPFRQDCAPLQEEMMRNLPTTPIDIDTLVSELTNHPDKDFVSYLTNGLRYGFNTGLLSRPQVPYICKNLMTAKKDPTAVKELIHTELSKGFLLGPFERIPYQIYRINPVGVAQHKYSQKKRLIVDLSAPHNNDDHPSLNSLIDKESHSLQYVKIDDAIKIIKQLGPGALLIKTDISDAFKLLPIHPDLWPFHGISHDGFYYFYTRLVFGSRSSPKIFDTLSEAICWIAQHNYGIENLLHLLDDFLVIVPPCINATTVKETFLNIFHKLKVPIALHKTDGPATALEYLGVILDSANMEARLPVDKVKRIQDTLALYVKRKTCTKREILSLLGHMNFASRVVRPGRAFVSHLIALSTTVTELHHHITLNAAVRSDLKMWALFLEQWNCASFFLDEAISPASKLQIYTDATPTAFGGFFNKHWFQGHFPGEFMKEQQSMALCELYPIVMACVLWGSQWSQKRILFHCDNMATVQIITKGRSKVPSIMKLMRRLTYHCAIHNFVILAQHIPGKQNLIADALSRFQMTTFRKLAPLADETPTACVPLQHLMMD